MPLPSALLIETIVTCVSYLQAISVHEIIDSFEDPKKSDMSYRYLMCWGLFAGQTLECEYFRSSCEPRADGVQASCPREHGERLKRVNEDI